MKKFKKAMAMGLATITVLSAMSMSAMAAMYTMDELNEPLNTNESEIMGEFLNQDGIYQTVTVDDVVSGNDTFVMANGVTVKFIIDYPNTNSFYTSMNSMRINGFTSNTIPSHTDTPYSIDNSVYDATANLGAYSTLYSDRVLNNGSSSNLMLSASPQGESLENTTYDLHCFTNGSLHSRYARLTGGTTSRAISLEGVDPNQKFFLELINSNSSERNPFVSIGGY